jgi:probable F420-dependent oxidoreductase
VKRDFRFGLQILEAAPRDEFTRCVRRAEELGFSSVLLSDHVTAGVHAPFSALAIAAAVTEKVRVGFHMINNDLRRAALVAHEAATLDLMSRGRLELGIGAGWKGPEYDELGIPYDPREVRVDRLAESIGIIKRLLAGESVNFDGKYYHVRNHLVNPGPVQKPVPLAIGESGKRLLSLAAREADIISFLDWRIDRSGRTFRYDDFTPEELERKIGLVRRVAGERFEQIELAAYVWYFQEGKSDRDAAMQVSRDKSLSIDDIISSPFTLLGSPDNMIEKVERNRERFGISYCVVRNPAMEAMKDVVSQLAGH